MFHVGKIPLQNPDTQISFYLAISALQLAPCRGLDLVTWRSVPDPCWLFSVVFGSKAHLSPHRSKEGENVCWQAVGISNNDENLLLNDKTDLTSFLGDNSL